MCWLSACGVAQAPLPSKDSAAGALRRKVVVNGNPIPVGKTLVKDGIAYVDVSALAEAMGASLKSDESGVTITQPEPKCEGGASGVEGERFSQQFRRDVAGIADEIESLRAVVLKKENVPLGPRFDAIDRKLKLATAHVQTDADMAVYYALAYANNSLAIAYYKQARGVPSEEAQKDQTDSMLCAMESKFALMKGVLVPGGSCSVFKRIETQGSPQPRE
ncbi:MAG TPA: hypothetical protein VE779_09555 [Candidatus Angelobacter sp.]|nr:hypothetical protein [Candidatus Angelobacter sp.]